MLEASRNVSPKTRLLVVGSSQEYGEGRKGLFKEQSPLLPAGAYGASKAALDFLAAQYHRNAGLHVVRARPFNHIGPRQKDLFAASSFASQIARIEAGLQKPVIRTGNLETERDFTDVRDVVRAYWLLLEKGLPGEVYNIASGRRIKIRRLLDICLAKSRVKIRIEKDPRRFRAQDVAGQAGDSSKLKNRTGWEPRIPLEKTISDLLEYWREKIGNRAGLERKN